MREALARAVCLVSVAFVLALAALVAIRLREKPPHQAKTEPVRSQGVALPSGPNLSAQIDKGKRLFVDQGCAACHCFAGVGNPRRPLDDAARRLGPNELRDWIVGQGGAAQLPASVLKRKHAYQALPEDDLSALAALLNATQATPP